MPVAPEKRREYLAAWRAANAERLAAYREKNRARRIGQGRDYYRLNAELLRAKSKQRREANRERVIAHQKEYREQNAVQLRVKRARYYQANREREAAQQRANDRARPEMYRERLRRRRARLRGAPGTEYTTAELIAARFEFYGNQCRWCGAAGELHADHVIALALGGAHLPANIVPACPSCNARKSDKPLADWLELVAA